VATVATTESHDLRLFSLATVPSDGHKTLSMFVLTVATAVMIVAEPSLVAAMFMKIIMGCGHRRGDYCCV